jgi:molecular chaperone IbpA
MTTLRFTHLYPSVVGFDQLLDTFDTMLTEKPTTFPPHNIVKVDENNYLVELAVAGFNESEITIEVLKNTLTIKGEKENLGDGRQYMHRGIGTRTFKKTVTLAETVQVDGASLESGILTVKLVNIVPVEKQPVKIAINTVSKPQLLQEKV